MEGGRQDMETKRPAAAKSIWESGKGLYLLPALPVGLGILLGWLCLLAGLMLLADATHWMLSLMLGIGLFAAAYGMGRFAAFHRRRYGLKTGLCCGALLYGVLLLCGIVWRGEGGSFLRPLLLLCGGAWGGVSGVHAVHRNPPR